MSEPALPASWDDILALQSDFLIAVIIIGIALCLLTALMVILYCWLYMIEKKIKQFKCNHNPEFTIRRAHIHNDAKPSTSPQNPLAMGNNFSAVVDDLKRTSNVHSNTPRYPNYINDNNNFSY